MARSRRHKQSATHARTPARSQSPSRKRPLVMLAAAVTVVVLLGAAAWRWLTPAPQGPVILISIDTLRADHLGIYGYTKGRTPNLDALARDSVVFDRGYAHAPQTLPSHSSMLTGLLPFEHGVRDNIGFSLKSGTPTMAGYFKSGGYATGGFASAYVLRPDTGIGQGFDTYNVDLPAGALDRPIAQVQRSGAATVAAAVKWIDARPDPRFFLFVHMYEPHRPYEPAPEFKDLDPYDAEIATADAAVGTLLGELRRRGLYDSATIAFVADHGEGLGDHGEEEHGIFLYEATIHVPFVLKLPREAGAGRRVATPVQHIDLLPTFGAIARLSLPNTLRGRNLVPAATGAALAAQGVYSEAMMSRYHFGWSELTSLTDERYKYIRAPRAELYDLQNDHAEAHNLLTARAEIASAMRNGLEGLTQGRGIDAPKSASTEDRERLAALGYIGSSSVSTDVEGLTLPDPKDKAGVRELFIDAARAIGELRFVDAAAKLKAVTTEDPGMTDAWNQYAQVLIRLGRDEDAFHAYQELLKRQPNAAPVLLDAATVLLRLQRYDEARAHAEAAIGGEAVTAHQLLSKIAMARHQTDEALTQAAAAEAADPSLPMTDFVHGVILRDEAQKNPAKFAEALPYFERAAQKIAGRTIQLNDLYYYLGDCLAQVGRLEEAETAFRKEIQLFPNLVRARTGLAMLYEAAGQPGRTDQVVNDMLAAVPTPATYAQAADLWRILGHPDKSAAVAAAARARFGR